MVVRPAEARDNDALCCMEEKSVQGTQIKLTVRRRDYFFRAKHFRDSVLMVAEDNGVLLGVMGMAFLRLRVGGTFHKGALIFDWRANPEISDRGLNPVMGRIWLALDAVARDRGVEFLFGLVKKDNERSKRILSRGGAQYVGTRKFYLFPVTRRRRVAAGVGVLDDYDFAEDRRLVAEHYRDYDLVPDWESGEEVLSRKYCRGLIRCGQTSIRLWDSSADYQKIAVSIPWYYSAARPVVQALRTFLPLPRIPAPGDVVRTWDVYDPIVHSQRELLEVMRAANNLAMEADADYLVVTADTREEELTVFGKRAIISLEYEILFKSLVEMPAITKTYCDIRWL